jgi:hypothetical protein
MRAILWDALIILGRVTFVILVLLMLYGLWLRGIVTP